MFTEQLACTITIILYIHDYVGFVASTGSTTTKTKHRLETTTYFGTTIGKGRVPFADSRVLLNDDL